MSLPEYVQLHTIELFLIPHYCTCYVIPSVVHLGGVVIVQCMYYGYTTALRCTWMIYTRGPRARAYIIHIHRSAGV